MTASSDGAVLGIDAAVVAPVVLVVDSDPVRRQRTALMIKRLGHALPQTAERVGDVAAARPGQALFDVVLLALSADDPNALDALSRSRPVWLAPGARIIVITGEDSADLQEPGLSTGGAFQLRRPLTRDALAAALSGQAMPSPGDDQDFNPVTWSEWLRAYGDAGLDELVAVMVADLADQQRRFASAAQAADLHALRQIAHALLGASLQFGAKDLAELCSRTESAALAGQSALALSLGQEMLERHAALVMRMRLQSRRS